MDIVVFHYHLNRGGVTRVVENQLRALSTLAESQLPNRVVVVYGGRAGGWNPQLAGELPFELVMAVLPELEYDQEQSASDDLLPALQQLLARLNCDRGSCVLHAHNHGLGKKAAFPAAIGNLADDGWRLLLQIHDFAEDLRPANYRHLASAADSYEDLQGRLYPQASQIHYAVLNQHDVHVFTAAGIDPSRLHLLPNAVSGDPVDPTVEEVHQARMMLHAKEGIPLAHKYVLYPVRGIRRKNLGELLLWSMLVSEATFGLTLAPLNPDELVSFEIWKALAESLELPVAFDVGHVVSLKDNYTASDAIITTSVAEGFGLVYLEASLNGRYLMGRSLPDILTDFSDNGMEFPGLADSVRLPAEWIDVQRLIQKYRELLSGLQCDYGIPPADASALDAEIESVLAGDTIDFGRLDSETQRIVLCRVRRQADLRQTLQDLNPFTQTIGCADADETRQCVLSNRRAIAEHYSLTAIGVKLREIYDVILASHVEKVTCRPRIARSVLETFVLPSRLFPVRIE